MQGKRKVNESGSRKVTGSVCCVGGSVNLCMPAPLEATETLMPE